MKVESLTRTEEQDILPGSQGKKSPCLSCRRGCGPKDGTERGGKAHVENEQPDGHSRNCRSVFESRKVKPDSAKEGCDSEGTDVDAVDEDKER